MNETMYYLIISYPQIYIPYFYIQIYFQILVMIVTHELYERRSIASESIGLAGWYLPGRSQGGKQGLEKHRRD